MAAIPFFVFLIGFFFKVLDVACTDTRRKENFGLWLIGAPLWLLLSSAICKSLNLPHDPWTVLNATIIPLVALYMGKKSAVGLGYLLKKVNQSVDKIYPEVCDKDFVYLPEQYKWKPKNSRN